MSDDKPQPNTKLGDPGDTIEAFCNRNGLRCVNWGPGDPWRHCCLWHIGNGKSGRCVTVATGSRDNGCCEASIAHRILDHVRCFSGKPRRLTVVVSQPYADVEMAERGISELADEFGLKGRVVSGKTWHGNDTIYVILQAADNERVYE